MTHFIRPAAHAAIAFGFAATAAFASAPAFAVDLDANPGWARSVGHAAAHVDGSASIAAIKPPISPPAVDVAIPAVAAVATVAESPKPRTLKELVSAHSSTQVSDRELECLAGAVYFESKGEPLEGQLAVAEVVINRSKSGRFPTSLCGVVKQKSQFSFVRGGRIPAIPRASVAWQKAVAIAQIATNDLAESTVSSALFFHARYVAPGWRGLKRMASVGNHIFYR